MERVPRAKRQKIHALNIIGRRKIKATRNHIPREVNQWIVAANGLIFFVTQSRGIMFLINIYRFSFVGILFAGEENPGTLPHGFSNTSVGALFLRAGHEC